MYELDLYMIILYGCFLFLYYVLFIYEIKIEKYIILISNK